MNPRPGDRVTVRTADHATDPLLPDGCRGLAALHGMGGQVLEAGTLNTYIILLDTGQRVRLTGSEIETGGP